MYNRYMFCKLATMCQKCAESICCDLSETVPVNKFAYEKYVKILNYLQTNNSIKHAATLLRLCAKGHILVRGLHTLENLGPPVNRPI